MSDDEEIPSDEASGYESEGGDEELSDEGASEGNGSSKGVDNRTRARNVKDQLIVWDLLLNARIKLQKLLVTSNKMPQCDVWPSIDVNCDPKLSQARERASDECARLTSALDQLRATLAQQSRILPSLSDDKNSESKNERDDNKKKSRHSVKGSRDSSDNAVSSGHTDRHEELIDVSKKIMDSWFQKTKYATRAGRIDPRQLEDDASIVTVIEQILSNKDRLLRKTQLKRSEYEILGKKVAEDESAAQSLVESKKEDPIDPEIFDDDDFYRQLLRQLIESKTSADSLDPVTLSRRWLEVQKLRSKMKKKIDTKASKGRKIRYQVHNPLISFMAPVDDCTYENNAIDALFASLFGKLKYNQA
ncbi:protein AATF-like [Brevipalpus obovatus]|uniref:protein AATF-like n=1 Tax=Brevipalpus obovatus TaxID=246614 RepID=UPI003D9ED7A5